VNGKEIRTGDVFTREQPADREKILFKTHLASSDVIREAIDGSLNAKKEWEALPMEHKMSIFLRAADLISTKYRDRILAATMMGQAKTMHQAEIDAACEAIDFLRFNALYASRVLSHQPEHNSANVWNRQEYRPLEGFVAAVSPFNFTAIGVNLAAAPAQMGNVVLWKPSETAVLSNYISFKALQEAGLPDGVIQFLPAKGPVFGDAVTNSPDLSGLHFTGSTPTFNHLWKQIASNLENYKVFPRIVGETGGKNYHYVHPSADVETVVHQTLRAAYEYSGQKCSALSRAYIPLSLWGAIYSGMMEELKNITIGKPNDPTSFSSAVIDERSFDKIAGFLDRAKKDKDVEIIAGGGYDKSKGYFIEPTIIVTTNPKSETMVNEIFGPVLTIYLYDDKKSSMEEILELINSTSMYALTGSIFAKDRYAIDKASYLLRNSSGNFYINDKSTGAVVGQQPFGGSRVSGTNDKAGSEFMLHRWVSIRSIKENFVGLNSTGYPSIDPRQ
jgi:1-pyrroline-5-carboxylate dehydrogenase